MGPYEKINTNILKSLAESSLNELYSNDFKYIKQLINSNGVLDMSAKKKINESLDKINDGENIGSVKALERKLKSLKIATANIELWNGTERNYGDNSYFRNRLNDRYAEFEEWLQRQ